VKYGYFGQRNKRKEEEKLQKQEKKRAAIFSLGRQ